MNIAKKTSLENNALHPRNTQAWVSQDFNLDEPERIYNICLLTVYEHRCPVNHVIYPRNTQAYSDNRCQDFNLDEPERIYNINCLWPLLKKLVNHIVTYPNTQVYSNARTSTWINQMDGKPDVHHFPFYSSCVSKIYM